MDTIRKHSKKRDAILNCLRETDAHPSAEWVYSRLKPQIPDLSLGTVYRNLALFKETGEAISLGTVMGLERFDPEVKHMIVFDVLSYDSPVGDKGDKMRLFLTEAGYQKFLESQERGEVKLKNHAKVSGGHLHYDRRDRAL